MKSKNKKKAQISLEFLLVVGIALILIFPATILFVNFVNTSSNEITTIEVQKIGDIFVKNSRLIYFYGDDAFIDLTIEFPEQIDGMLIRNNILFIETNNELGNSTTIFDFGINVVNKTFFDDDFSQGLKTFRIINNNNTIDIVRKFS